MDPRLSTIALDLAKPPPRKTPPWWRSTATRALWAWLIVAAAYVLLVVLGTTKAVLLIPALSGTVIAKRVLAERSIRALLTKGDAGLGVVIETRDGPVVTLRYSYSTPRGTLVSFSSLPIACVVYMGFVPVEGDTVFVVFDPNGSGRNVVWGYASAGERPRAPFPTVPLRLPPGTLPWGALGITAVTWLGLLAAMPG